MSSNLLKIFCLVLASFFTSSTALAQDLIPGVVRSCESELVGPQFQPGKEGLFNRVRSNRSLRDSMNASAYAHRSVEKQTATERQSRSASKRTRVREWALRKLVILNNNPYGMTAEIIAKSKSELHQEFMDIDGFLRSRLTPGENLPEKVLEENKAFERGLAAVQSLIREYVAYHRRIYEKVAEGFTALRQEQDLIKYEEENGPIKNLSFRNSQTGDDEAVLVPSSIFRNLRVEGPGLDMMKANGLVEEPYLIPVISVNDWNLLRAELRRKRLRVFADNWVEEFKNSSELFKEQARQVVLRETLLNLRDNLRRKDRLGLTNDHLTIFRELNAALKNEDLEPPVRMTDAHMRAALLKELLYFGWVGGSALESAKGASNVGNYTAGSVLTSGAKGALRLFGNAVSFGYQKLRLVAFALIVVGASTVAEQSIEAYGFENVKEKVVAWWTASTRSGTELNSAELSCSAEEREFNYGVCSITNTKKVVPGFTALKALPENVSIEGQAVIEDAQDNLYRYRVRRGEVRADRIATTLERQRDEVVNFRYAGTIYLGGLLSGFLPNKPQMHADLEYIFDEVVDKDKTVTDPLVNRFQKNYGFDLHPIIALLEKDREKVWKAAKDGAGLPPEVFDGIMEELSQQIVSRGYYFGL